MKRGGAFMFRYFVFCSVACFTFLTANAQNCTQQLNRVEDDFEAGRLLRIPEIIEILLDQDECLSKEEKIRARKLLTKVYIFLDEEAKAEYAMEGLLKADPEHILSRQLDPKELFFLMDQFRTDPIFRIALKVGVNASSVNLIGDYSTSNPANFPKFYNGKTADGASSFNYENQTFNSTSGAGVGYNAELSVEKYLDKGFEIGLGGQVRCFFLG
jgi:hypothetical protein